MIEGDPGETTTITFTITRSGDSRIASSVDYEVMPDTPVSATIPEDYAPPEALSGTKGFAVGETEQTITLTITNDLIPEETETFKVTLSNPVNAEIIKPMGTGTILDNDQPTLSIDDVSATEGDPGDTTSITFTVTRAGDNGAASTVEYAVLPDTAITPDGYAPGDALTGTLTFAAGETEKTITLDITDDDVPEGTESFTVELDNASNATIIKSVGTGTIIDDEQPSLSISPCSRKEKQKVSFS